MQSLGIHASRCAVIASNVAFATLATAAASGSSVGRAASAAADGADRHGFAASSSFMARPSASPTSM